MKIQEFRRSELGVEDRSVPSSVSTPVCWHHSLLLGKRDPTSESPPESPIFEVAERVANRRRNRQPSTPTDGTDTRRARFVRFFGDCYALLTEWSSWHVLNDLIYTAEDDDTLPRIAEVSDLTPGDFVLFRAGGDSEFVRLIAEDNMGREEYRRIRAVSDRWKRALNRLGYSPSSVQRRLARYGLHRTSGYHYGVDAQS